MLDGTLTLTVLMYVEILTLAALPEHLNTKNFWLPFTLMTG